MRGNVNRGPITKPVSIEGLGQSLFRRAAQYRGPVELGWYDFVNLFRRSVLGPFWATAQLALWIATIALIFHERLGDGIGSYTLYVGLGFFAWDFISWSMSEGPKHFTAKGHLLKNIPIALSEITVRRISFLFFRSLFQLPVPIFIIIFFGQPLNWSILFLLPVAVLYLVGAFSIITIGGIVGTYFRDFQFIMPTLLRFLFFTTPIFWQGDVGIRKAIADYNPFSYFVEILREPLSGNPPSLLAWIITCSITAVGFCIAIYLQSNIRNQILYRV